MRRILSPILVLVLSGWIIGCASSPKGSRDVASIPKGDSSGEGINLRALRGLASKKDFSGNEKKVSVNEVAQILNHNAKSFSPEIAFERAYAKDDQLFIELKNTSLEKGNLEKTKTPKCHMNQDSRTPEKLSLAFKGDFFETTSESVRSIRHSENGWIGSEEQVVKSFVIQLSENTESNQKPHLIGLELYDVASGFEGNFNAFWSGRSVLCSAEEPLGASRLPASSDY